MSALYRLTFPSGKQYIGITTRTVRWRFNTHVRRAKAGSSYPVCAAIRKYGSENVIVETLFCVKENTLEAERALLRLFEREAIAKYQTVSPKGYNVTLGGEGVLGLNRPKSPEHRAKLAAVLRRPDVIEAGNVCRRARKGIPKDTPWLIGNKSGRGNRGKVRSAEVKARISAAKKGKKRTDQQRATLVSAHRRPARRRLLQVLLERLEQVK